MPLSIHGQKNYSDVPIGELVGLVGSHGWVEIACNGGERSPALASHDRAGSGARSV